jgi:hypothetical protein
MCRIVLVTLGLTLLAALTPVRDSARALTTIAASAAPKAVVALIDTGINPYAPAFRDRSSTATQHPSTYIPGYPKKARALRLSLEEASLSKALKKDAQVWESVLPRQLYWIPGTKIVGAISMGTGGRSCNREVQGQELPTLPPPGGQVNVGPGCPERPILDDAGHGTMTASRAAGSPHSLAPGARIVAIEGLGEQNSLWAAEQPWIDIQSNSWGYATGLLPAGMTVFREIADDHLVVTASGNGIGFSGFGPEPTYAHALSAPGVVIVGGHDNGHVTAWSGIPPHVVADAFAPYTALHDSLGKMRPDPVACCTSTSAPYVAGGAAAIVLEARRILGDGRTGVRDGVVARGPKNLVAKGPLKDGVFTLTELRRVLYRTAEARPREGRDDGHEHFLGEPGSQPRYADPWGVGENPYCQGCWTAPLAWGDVPAEVSVYPLVGYGTVNERSIALARGVLRGKKSLPARADEDAFFAQDEALREAIWGVP